MSWEKRISYLTLYPGRVVFKFVVERLFCQGLAEILTHDKVGTTDVMGKAAILPNSLPGKGSLLSRSDFSAKDWQIYPLRRSIALPRPSPLWEGGKRNTKRIGPVKANPFSFIILCYYFEEYFQRKSWSCSPSGPLQSLFL